jgi:hypothetical protein
VSTAYAKSLPSNVLKFHAFKQFISCSIRIGGKIGEGFVKDKKKRAVKWAKPGSIAIYAEAQFLRIEISVEPFHFI